MSRYRPRRAPGLPPGQRLLADMPRFSDNPLLPPPPVPDDPVVELSVEREPLATVPLSLLDELGPRDLRADFHCVTTWSVQGLLWRGVPLREVLAAVGVTEAPAPYVVAKGADGPWTQFLWEDLVAEDVFLATLLGGEPLDGRHGAPVRLVTPRQYGYKNVKHLSRLDFRHAEPRPGPKHHLRARVALEERHASLPAWVVRAPYRSLVGPTARISERTWRRADGAATSVGASGR